MTLPQIRGMYGGDRSGKRLWWSMDSVYLPPLDNRPLNFAEFNDRINQVIYTSARLLNMSIHIASR